MDTKVPEDFSDNPGAAGILRFQPWAIAIDGNMGRQGRRKHI